MRREIPFFDCVAVEGKIVRAVRMSTGRIIKRDGLGNFRKRFRIRFHAEGESKRLELKTFHFGSIWAREGLEAHIIKRKSYFHFAEAKMSIFPNKEYVYCCFRAPVESVISVMLPNPSA